MATPARLIPSTFPELQPKTPPVSHEAYPSGGAILASWPVGDHSTQNPSVLRLGALRWFKECIRPSLGLFPILGRPAGQIKAAVRPLYDAARAERGDQPAFFGRWLLLIKDSVHTVTQRRPGLNLVQRSGRQLPRCPLPASLHLGTSALILRTPGSRIRSARTPGRESSLLGWCILQTPVTCVVPLQIGKG